MRIGTGYDVHKLVEGRKLILGGVTRCRIRLVYWDIRMPMCFCMRSWMLSLGAAGLGDIGKAFSGYG